MTVEAAEELAEDSTNQDGGTIKPIPSEGGGNDSFDIPLETTDAKIDVEAASKAESLH